MHNSAPGKVQEIASNCVKVRCHEILRDNLSLRSLVQIDHVVKNTV